MLELKAKLVPNLPYKVYVNNDKDDVSVEEINLLKQFMGNNSNITGDVVSVRDRNCNI